MIIVYWWIVRFINMIERSSNPSPSNNKRGETRSDFVWFDHFENDHTHNQGGNNDTDDSFDSPDW